MMKKITIGLLGCEFHSDNLGCSALAYSLLHILAEILPEDVSVLYKIHTVGRKLSDIALERENWKYDFLRFSIRKRGVYRKFCEEIQRCDLVFDLTEGDSFSDIYGLRRFLFNSMQKTIALRRKIPLILGPQTLGPFKHIFTQIWAKYILLHAERVISRDKLSVNYLEELHIYREIDRTTDLAFALPYTRDRRRTRGNGPRRAGVNPSGLLWNGGYTGKNQFDLTVDYKSFLEDTITFLKDNHYEVYLIPHVIVRNDYGHCENDFKICVELHEKFQFTVVAPEFKTPMEAKSYISGMDIFIGSRMHATIAAFSSGVATIPFSYSRKFEGLYENIGYPYVICGTKLSTREALERLKDWVGRGEQLEDSVKRSLEESGKLLKRTYQILDEILQNIVEGKDET